MVWGHAKAAVNRAGCMPERGNSGATRVTALACHYETVVDVNGRSGAIRVEVTALRAIENTKIMGSWAKDLGL